MGEFIWDGLNRIDGVFLRVKAEGTIELNIPLTVNNYSGSYASENLGECSIREARELVDLKYPLGAWWYEISRKFHRSN